MAALIPFLIVLYADRPQGGADPNTVEQFLRIMQADFDNDAVAKTWAGKRHFQLCPRPKWKNHKIEITRDQRHSPTSPALALPRLGTTIIRPGLKDIPIDKIRPIISDWWRRIKPTIREVYSDWDKPAMAEQRVFLAHQLLITRYHPIETACLALCRDMMKLEDCINQTLADLVGERKAHSG